MSSSADPSEPSFLATLPAELRNAVYEILFKRDEPVLVHNVAAYLAKEPKMDPIETIEDFADSMREFEERYEEDIGKDSEFAHTLGYGLSLLRFCRQIYHEAACVLYGGKVFTISWSLHRHDDHYDLGFYADKEYNQLNYAQVWLC